MNILADVGLVIVVATIFAALARLLKQPLIIAYVLAGIVIGPMGLALISNSEVVTSLSEFGIAFLLFIVGLEIDLKRMRDVGKVVIGTGLCQMLCCFAAGYLGGQLFGFTQIQSVYAGLIVSFSSTMIVIKLLSDKRELDTLHGRIVLGILLLQDVVAIIALAVLASLGLSAESTGAALLKGLLLFAITFLAARYMLPKLFSSFAQSQELLFLSSLSWCFLLSGEAYAMGYSIAIGAFLAGVSLAPLSYNLEIAGKVKSLRDFFATIFFVSLGMQIAIGTVPSIISQVAFFAAIVLLLNPLAIMVAMGIMGHKRKVSFLTGIALTQTSEFSLILASLGLSMGHLPQETVSMTALLAVATISITSYLIQYANPIYQKLSPALGFLDRLSRSTYKIDNMPRRLKPRVILCGYNRIGYSILEKVKTMRKPVLVVDYNPELIKQLTSQGIPCLYGDVADLKVIERMSLKGIEMLISTVPELDDNMLLIQEAREANAKAILIVTANQVDDALMLYSEGADYVILPHFLGGEHVSSLLEDFASDLKSIIRTKVRHIQELYRRKELGQRHPVHS